MEREKKEGWIEGDSEEGGWKVGGTKKEGGNVREG